MEELKPKRGRKKLSEGGKSSPKEIFCSCAAIVNGELIHKSVLTSLGNSASDEELVLEAKNIFKKEHGIEPSVLEMTFFARKGVVSLSKKSEKNEISKVSFEDAVFKQTKPGTAIYKNWNVSFRRLENNEDVVWISYKQHVSEDKRTKPQSKFVQLSDLQNLIEN